MLHMLLQKYNCMYVECRPFSTLSWWLKGDFVCLWVKLSQSGKFNVLVYFINASKVYCYYGCTEWFVLIWPNTSNLLWYLAKYEQSTCALQQLKTSVEKDAKSLFSCFEKKTFKVMPIKNIYFFCCVSFVDHTVTLSCLSLCVNPQ